MIENVKYEGLLTLGYFNKSANETKHQDLLSKFKEKFDIVITNDGNLWPLNAVIQFISGNEIAKESLCSTDFVSMLNKIQNA